MCVVYGLCMCAESIVRNTHTTTSSTHTHTRTCGCQHERLREKDNGIELVLLTLVSSVEEVVGCLPNTEELNDEDCCVEETDATWETWRPELDDTDDDMAWELAECEEGWPEVECDDDDDWCLFGTIGESFKGRVMLKNI